MPRIGIVIGNGFAIDYCQTQQASQAWRDPSDPFRWEFAVPNESGLDWHLAFPLLKQSIDSYGVGVHSFDAFASLMAKIRSRHNNNTVRLDAEARQFLAFAYSVFQQEIGRVGVVDWRWSHWLGEHASQIVGAVSFNYDLLLESAAESVGLSLAPFAVSGKSQGRFLLKPHGSIDFECNPRAINMPVSTYPLSNWATLNNVPLIALDPKALRQPRQEAFIVLPTETSPYLTYQWVSPGYQRWRRDLAGNLTHCIFLGLSYWSCDRKEIDFLIDSLPTDVTIILANPEPPRDLVARLKASGRRSILWRDGPQSIHDGA